MPHSLSLLMVWVSFAVGWLLAPIGGMIFGFIGDKYGRARALILSMLAMSCSSILIAVLPAYQSVGFIAPVALALSRVFQGLSSSGEYNGAAIFLIENASVRLKPFFGCLPNISNSAGMMLGFFAASFFTSSFMPDWAWRIPFLLASVGIFCSYRLRIATISAMTPLLHKTAISIKNLKKIKKAVPMTIALAAYNGVTSWGIYIWGSVLLIHYGLSVSEASSVIMIGLIIDIFLEPLTGLIAIRFSNKHIFILWSVLFATFLYPVLSLLEQGTFLSAICFIVLVTILLSPPTAMINSLVIESFPLENRYLSIGFIWNIGMSVFGGTTPLMLSLFVHHSDFPYALILGVYCTIFVIAGILSVIFHAKNKV